MAALDDDQLPKALELNYDPVTGTINLQLFEHISTQAEPIGMSLDYEYHPETGTCPIHEKVKSKNKSIKEAYWQLWDMGGGPDGISALNPADEFQGEIVEVKEDEIEQFCKVVGNEQESYKGKGRETSVPMDFAIKLGWKSIMRAIFPDAIDGDLLKLVHLSNGFEYVPDAPEIKVGDQVTSTSRITSVTNSDTGKTVKVSGTVYIIRESRPVPVIHVNSGFFYRGRFDDDNTTFSKVTDSPYKVDIKASQDAAILLSKEWFEWENEEPLAPGTSLTFETVSDYRYKSKDSYTSVEVTGTVTVPAKEGNKRIKVANVSYSSSQVTKGNPVIEFLKRHGAPVERHVMFESPYSLTQKSDPCVILTPASNEDYSRISGDWNPIHVNPYFSSFAALPGTITHGMFTSAATRKYVEQVAAENKPERVVAYEVNFTSMVLPNSTLHVNLKHAGQTSTGNKIIDVSTVDVETGTVVLAGQAQVKQATSAYVFTGQGSQEQGMGMELYATSEVARKVWDEADKHLGDVYGFSIIDIVKNNPQELTVHFGGIKGHAIRQRYIDYTYTSADKDGTIKTLPLFPDITLRSTRYTFSSPTGLLFATQFTQIALCLVEKAAFEDMKSKGLIQEGCAFAGHSLGEYSALASFADVLPISALVDVVFYRGITMQRAVERDHLNRSNYGMCAVNPSRIGKTFNETALREIVDTISKRADVLLEIVNYNVEGQQYVAAGDLVGLHTLTSVLNFIKVQKLDLKKLTEIMSIEDVKEKLNLIVDECSGQAKELKAKEGFIHLERGFATIPLPGIDVPFHSRYLWAGVLPFRTYLSRKINPADVDPDLLVGRYIPNLTAEPFQISKEYAERIYNQTASPRLESVLKEWENETWDAAENRSKLGYIILVELLAYQFASPVRWIETQDRLLGREFRVERLIEVGPSPTLAGMATRTVNLKYAAQDSSIGLQRQIFCTAKHTTEIYYKFEDAPEEAPAETESAAPAATPAAPVVAAPVAAAPAASGPVAQVEDAPIKAIDTLRTIIAQKLKKPIQEVPLSKSVKDLVGGKSTLQNEILGDLQAEFGSAPEKAEEMPLDELGGALNVGYSGTLGKYTSGLISRLVGGKLPGGFGLSNVKSHFSKQWGLGTGRTDGALLQGITMEPAKRLGSEAEAKAWLDAVAQAYAQSAGISLSAGGAAAGGAGGGSGGVVIDSEALEKLQGRQDEFVEQQLAVFMRYLKRDTRDGHRLNDDTRSNLKTLEERMDSILREHGDSYLDGIQPVFEPLKARHFNSAYNWVRQDALSMFWDIIFGRLTSVDRDVTRRCLIIMNRADPVLLEYMRYHLDNVPVHKGPTYKLAQEFGRLLLKNCEDVLGLAPVYKDVTFPTAPKTDITGNGDIKYSEVQRPGVSRLEKYVAEMAAGSKVTTNVNLDKVHDSISNLYRLVKSQPNISRTHMTAIRSLYGEVVRSMGRQQQQIQPARSPTTTTTTRARRPSNQFLRPVTVADPVDVADDKIPLLHLRRKVGNEFHYSSKLSSLYLDILKEIATSGTTFEHKNALLTGVGKGSIGVEVLRGLLSGGARVVITTSRYSRATVEYYQAIYQEVGSRGSSLTVVPFNQGSKQDVEALVEYIYSDPKDKGLGLDLDYILPFAALPENGRQIDGIDDKSELAHRIMLTNLLRLLGAVKTKKASRRFITRPTQVVLPLSPNHGTFGNDGLYSESKISLEILFNRWGSESWGEYLCIAGAVIGWTRGTGLMSQNNIVAGGLEDFGCRTFSAKEMAFNILGLMHPLLFDVCQIEPIWADFNGGMSAINELDQVVKKLRTDLLDDANTRKAISVDNAADFKVIHGEKSESLHKQVKILPRANFQLPFPEIKEFDAESELAKLRGVVDLDKVVVFTGYAEVGPFGSSRTRWQIEALGEFHIEGLLELAFITGLIKHFDGRLPSGKTYTGWVDAKSLEPLDDKDVRTKYEKHIIEHTGIRLIEPELFRGYDPKRKGFTQEIELNHDLEPIETSAADLERFRLEHGDKVDIWSEGDRCFVKFRKGARIMVPKAVRFDRLVAGQVPTGWDARVFGIPEDIIAQVDRTALWALVCVAEALMMSGITDPYELYKWVHPSEVGTALGSGMGGMTSLSKMFRDRREEKDVQKDILQETFINTVAGWVNMLLLSSSGPIKIPVGACATAIQSVDIACETILSGKAKVMVCGGFDDFSEEGSFEFANMGATSNTETEFASGREPNEMSRPTTSTRAGFMESQGCGVHVLMSASTAIKMGATIYGIVGHSATATDKAGRSVPAPGKGVLSTAREIPDKASQRMLDLTYRKRQIQFRNKQVSDWLDNEIALLRDEIAEKQSSGSPLSEQEVGERITTIEKEAGRQRKQTLATFGMLEGCDTSISPLRRGLAVWGLTIDDVGVASFHGTSTKLNDKNESDIFNSQFKHLGRTPGNACPVIAQKWLTGHPKGGAAAFMTNGVIQSINDGLIPGNRNADNIGPELQQYTYLVYPSRSIQTDGLKAGILKSFGFGQVGGEALIIHPDYIIAALEPNVRDEYKAANDVRRGQAYRKFNDVFVDQKNTLIQLKEAPPYPPELEAPVLLNPLARITANGKGSYSYTASCLPTETSNANFKVAEQLASQMAVVAVSGNIGGVGTDVEVIGSLPVDNVNFIERNFTIDEIEYCRKSPDSKASFAARWAAKEACFKSLGVESKGAGSAMKTIEVVASSTGPSIKLHGEAAEAASSKGLSKFNLSMSHTDDIAMAVVVSS